jgi:hypothetical protein
MDKFKLPIKTDYVDNILHSPILTEYDPKGEYLCFRRINVPEWRIVTIDANGIPRNLHHGGQHYNPVTVAHYALELYSCLMHDSENTELEDKLKKVIAWCLQAQLPEGGWPFTFDHMFFKHRVEQLKTPWYSALSQGMMISVLTRAALRYNFDFESPIQRSLDIILRDVEHGGVKRKIFNQYVMYEEYPTTPASCVLNGFMFCLLGLYDGHQATGEQQYLDAFEDGITTLEAILPLYDLGHGTSYDLTHLTARLEGPNQARNSYHRLHIQLLSTLDVIVKGRFSRIANRWDNYLRGNSLCTN